MNLEQEILSIKRSVERIAAAQRSNNKWVTAWWIQQLTGWNAAELNRARKQNLLKWKYNKNGGIEYWLADLPDVFIKHKKDEPEIITAKKIA